MQSNGVVDDCGTAEGPAADDHILYLSRSEDECHCVNALGPGALGS